MKKFFRGAEGILCIALIALLMAGLAGVLWMNDLLEQTPAFHDLTLELGQPLPPVSQFVNEDKNPDKAILVTPVSQIDLTKLGNQTLTFQYQGREETVTLTIRDTVAPVVKLQNLVLPLGQLPAPEELVAEVQDFGTVTIRFAQEYTAPTDFGTMDLTVEVRDASGNVTTGNCTVTYAWLRQHVVVELGDPLEIQDLLLRPQDAALFTDQGAVDQVNASGIGTYTLTSTHGSTTCECVVTVQDTVAPLLEVQPLLRGLDDPVDVMDFVVNAQDRSGTVEVSYGTEPDLTLLGTQTVTLEARDSSGNVTVAETTLEIREDIKAPVFQGVEEMRVEINSRPDYELGVVAVDNKDGYVNFTYDASRADTSKSGSFYVTYTAVDKAGNKAVVHRKIIVDHDQSDINAKAAAIAAELEDDPMACFQWVQSHLWYIDSWGDGDPTWYGLTKRMGNCYVYAHVLQALLEQKGYQTRLIWTTCKTHYWVILEVSDGVWRHLDATPGEIHSRYGLMTDAQRQETISDVRTWDRSQWPACE